MVIVTVLSEHVLKNLHEQLSLKTDVHRHCAYIRARVASPCTWVEHKTGRVRPWLEYWCRLNKSLYAQRKTVLSHANHMHLSTKPRFRGAVRVSSSCVPMFRGTVRDAPWPAPLATRLLARGEIDGNRPRQGSRDLRNLRNVLFIHILTR